MLFPMRFACGYGNLLSSHDLVYTKESTVGHTLKNQCRDWEHGDEHADDQALTPAVTAKTVSNRVGLYWGELSPFTTCNGSACRRIRMPMGQANSQQQFSNDCGAPTEVLPKAFPKEKPWKGHGALKQLIVSLLAILPTTLLPRMWMLGSRTRKMYTTSTKAIESIGQRPNKVTLHICKAHQAATNLSWEFQEVNTGKQFSKTYTTELIDHDCDWKWKRNHARSCHSVQHTVERHGHSINPQFGCSHCPIIMVGWLESQNFGIKGSTSPIPKHRKSLY